MLEARFLLKPSDSDGLLPPLPPLCFSIAFHTETASLSKEERKEIADKLKTKYKTINKKFKNRTETILWIINNQLGRRNISNYDRTRLALRFEEIISPGQGARTELSQKSDKVDTKKEIIKSAGFDSRSVKTIKITITLIKNKRNNKKCWVRFQVRRFESDLLSVKTI